MSEVQFLASRLLQLIIATVTTTPKYQRNYNYMALLFHIVVKIETAAIFADDV